MAERDDVYESWTAKFPALRSVQNPILFLNNATVERDGDVKYLMRDKFYDNIMLELALLIGVIHISLSFLRSIRTSWAGLGWIAFMVGGYLFFPIYLNATSLLHFTGMITKATAAEAGMELIYGGIGAAGGLAILQYRLGGLGEIINIIQVFADVLSYLRLYALGLAGSMMSATFNDIGGSMPIVAGLLVILIGHVVNIALSVMGGVIHGLRLNFLEWYHYSFEGGGKMFKPLSLLKIK
jgi:V/A-type H+-transporting ATPase subunit I